MWDCILPVEVCSTYLLVLSANRYIHHRWHHAWTMFSTIVGHVKNVLTLVRNAHIRSCNLFHRHATTIVGIIVCAVL